jgi:hypothetical protein
VLARGLGDAPGIKCLGPPACATPPNPPPPPPPPRPLAPPARSPPPVSSFVRTPLSRPGSAAAYLRPVLPSAPARGRGGTRLEHRAGNERSVSNEPLRTQAGDGYRYANTSSSCNGQTTRQAAIARGQKPRRPRPTPAATRLRTSAGRARGHTSSKSFCPIPMNPPSPPSPPAPSCSAVRANASLTSAPLPGTSSFESCRRAAPRRPHAARGSAWAFRVQTP